jgi:hypothetical protein
MFPSEVHRQAILEKPYSQRSRDELWYHHAYNYGWQRVFRQDRSDVSPIDPKKQWFNGEYVRQAEVFWRQYFNQNIKTRKAPPTQDDKDRYRIAAVYRWRMDQGRPLATELSRYDPKVLEAEDEYNNRPPDPRAAEQEAELAKLRPAAEAEDREGIKDGPANRAYIELCAKFIRDNIADYVRRQKQMRP